MAEVKKRIRKYFLAPGASLAVLFGATTIAGVGAANAPTPPLSVTLSADGNGTAVFNASSAPVLTVGSTATYPQMAVNLSAGSLAPTTTPTFDTNNYAEGPPRWVIELANGNFVDCCGNEVIGGTGPCAVGNSGTYEPYATALSGAGDPLGNVQVTNAFIVKDTGQVVGTSDTLTNVQYNGQTLQGTVTVTNPGSQSWIVGQAASLQIAATTNTSDTTPPYAATGLPAGVTINSSTGLISGAPTTMQSYTTTVTATNAYGNANTQAFACVTSVPGLGNPSGLITSQKLTVDTHPLAVDDPAGTLANGNPQQVWESGTGSTGHPANQQWTIVHEGGVDAIELTRDTKFCLDVTGHGTANGTKIQLWTCNGGVDQTWAPQTNGTLEAVNATSVEGHAMVLDDPSGKGNGTKLQIWEEGGLNGSTGNLNNQLWTVPL